MKLKNWAEIDGSVYTVKCTASSFAGAAHYPYRNRLAPVLKILYVPFKVAEDRELEEEDVCCSHASILQIAQGCSSSLVHLTLHNFVFRETNLI